MRIAIVTGGTEIDAIAVLAVNIKRVMPNLNADFVVFFDKIDKKTKEKIASVLPTKFIKYKCPVSKWKLLRNGVIRYFSPMVFCKYECFRLLEEYDIVVWTDYDIVIRQDISEILGGERETAFVSDSDVPLKSMFRKEKRLNVDMSEFDLNGESLYTPLFVLHKRNRDYNQICKWCYDQTERLSKYLYLPEQCIITMLFQKEKIEFDRLDFKTYCTHPKASDGTEKIIHASGQPKFWNGLYNKEWEIYHSEWEKIKKI